MLPHLKNAARTVLSLLLYFQFASISLYAGEDFSIFKNLQAGKNQTVVLYGTSLTAYGAWAKATKDWFDQHYPGLVTVLNTAGPGQNSNWAVTNLKSHVLDHHPDLVFIEFSYNDAHEKFHLTLDQGAQNLDTLVKAIQAQDPKTTILLQVMNIGWDAPNGKLSQSARPQLELFNDNYRRYAQEHQLPLLDHYPIWKQLKESDPTKFQIYVPDGTHPSPEGSLAFTWPTVKAWLEKEASPTK